MPWYTMIAIYFIVWWVVFFAVLPWGLSERADGKGVALVPGADPGAPAAPQLGLKVLWTTAIAAVLSGLFFWAYLTRVVAFEDLATLWGLLR
jgi:predicted secreted protein